MAAILTQTPSYSLNISTTLWNDAVKILQSLAFRRRIIQLLTSLRGLGILLLRLHTAQHERVVHRWCRLTHVCALHFSALLFSIQLLLLIVRISTSDALQLGPQSAHLLLRFL